MSTSCSSEEITDDSLYRSQYLYRNRCRIITTSSFLELQEVPHRVPEVKALLHLFRSGIDPGVQLGTDICDVVKSVDVPFNTIEGGYGTKDIIEQAVFLRAEVEDLDGEDEISWGSLLETQVWRFFDLQMTFSAKRAELWRLYDPALVQLLPDRAALARPKPDFAIGIKKGLDPSAFDIMIMDYVLHSIPAVDLSVSPEIACPFFICQSDSNMGRLRSAENRLANSMVMAHDILCSLNAQDELYVLGLVQQADCVRFYVSFSTRAIDEDGKAFTQRIRIIRLMTCGLDVNGCLSLLRFIEHVKEYGKTTFTRIVKEKSELAYAQMPSV